MNSDRVGHLVVPVCLSLLTVDNVDNVRDSDVRSWAHGLR
jgi:hypothetical protein